MDTSAFKAELRRLAAANELERLIDRLLDVVQGDEYRDYRTQVIHQSAQLEQWKRQQRQGTEDYADLARTRNRVSLVLLNLIDDFPSTEELMRKPSSPAGVSEDSLRNRLFWILVVSKLLVIGFAYLLWNSGGFASGEFIAVAGILLPTFAVYFTLMLQHTTATRRILQPGDRRVSKGYARSAYVLAIAYPLILLLLLDSRGRGSISFPTLAGLLTATEVGMGTYVGKYVFALFRNSR